MPPLIGVKEFNIMVGKASKNMIKKLGINN